MPAVVAGLFIYPVKSCRGIPLQRASVETRGLRHDRRWMIVDAEGTFITQRKAPRLALVETALDADAGVLVLRAPGQAELRLDLAPSQGAMVRVRVWKSDLEAVDGGEQAARWASAVVGTPSSMVFMSDAVERTIAAQYGEAGDRVSFADGFPLLLATRASLDDLNARLDTPLPMNRFRPNVVLDGCAPWEEDGWRRARLGELPVRLPKLCDRCVVTTVDQDTAEGGVEPLRTMATFRRMADGKVYFGANAIPDARGVIAVGDPFTVLE